jgi:GTP pyrophosphokinase
MQQEVVIEKGKNKILNRYRGLLQATGGTLTKDEQKALRTAFNMALNASAEKKDYLGEQYIFFPIGVARIVAKELDLGYHSLICSLLYNFVRDGEISVSRIKAVFGDKIVNIINGLSELSRYDSIYHLLQTENYRKLILSISSDIRVVLIKLAQRMYVMRHLHRLPKKDQVKQSLEVTQLYSPLAHRLGLYNLKTELEDLAFKYQYPEAYRNIVEKLKNTATKRNRYIRRFIKPIKDELEKQGFDIDIKGRTKSVTSIWNKMENKQVEFEEVYDLFAIRIIINNKIKDEKSDCWSVYSVVTNIYQPNPSRLRDWISVPKSNGYESLHTTVIGPGRKWVEVQIRTNRMNQIAERGLAAHWKYKGGKEDSKTENWLAQIRELLDSNGNDNNDPIENIKFNLFTDEVFVFTPKGDLKKFPKGATVLDFAFDIHTDVGSTCTGAKVNERNVPIRHKLRNGDTIEILTSKNQKPKSDWLEFVSTTKAKSKIKQVIRQEKQDEARNGKEIFKRRLKNWKISFNDENIQKLLHHLKYKKVVDLYYDIASGKIDLTQHKDLFVHPEKEEKQDEAPTLKVDTPIETKSKGDDFLVIEDQIENVDYKLAKCCNPIFGDDIFGFISVSGGIKIHRKDCPNAQQLRSKYNYRILKTKWKQKHDKAYYEANINVFGFDDIGIVNNISSIISNDLRVNMRSISFNSNEGMFEGKIGLLVRNADHLNDVMKKIENVKGITAVERQLEDSNHH